MASVLLKHGSQIQYTFSNQGGSEYSIGVVTGLITLLSQQAGPNPKYTIELGSNIFTLVNLNSFRTAMQNYLVVEDIGVDRVYTESNRLPSESIGWWILGFGANRSCNLYQFTTPDFAYGFIDAFAPFQKDFRSYIAGPPFRYSSNLGRPLFEVIPGYEITNLEWPRVKSVDIIVPFQTGANEAGVADGSDWE